MKNSKKSLSLFLLVMINLVTVLSIRNWPMTAMYGYTSIFYLVISMLLFFIPCAFVSAELAALFPEKGGVFVWIKEALGHKMGFLAIWLLWVENIVWYPTILSFISGTLAYIFKPSLADDPVYTCVMIIVVFWAITLANFRGIKFTGKFSAFCVIAGTFIPAFIILGLGGVSALSGKESMLDISSTPLIPDFSGVAAFSILTGILLSFAGLEMPAVHASDVKNPKKNYPLAIFLSAGVIVILTIMGTLCIANTIAPDNISLISGTLATLQVFLEQYQLSPMMPILALLIAIGAIGGVSSWVVGPCKGLLAAAEHGDLPPIMQKTNDHGMPYVLMIIQGVIVSVLSLLFVLMPNISSSFWMLTVLAAQLYIVMYILLFTSGIVLKYKKKNTKRVYSVPFGNIGMWVISGTGLISVSFALIVGFFPPPEIEVVNIVFFECFLFFGILLMVLTPFIIYSFRKPSWNKSHKQPKT